MKITYPSVKVGIPSEREIITIVSVMCRHCGLNPKGILVQVIGANRRDEFPQMGFKLTSHDQSKQKFAVPAVVGTEFDCFRALIGYEESGKTLFGNTLFDRLHTRFCGRKLIVSEKMIRDYRAQESLVATNGNGQHLNGPVEKEFSYEVPNLDVNVDDTREPLVAEVISTSPPQVESSNDTLHYEHFFDDPEKLHLAVVALVSRYKMDEPFSFGEFISVLAEDVGMPRSTRPSNMMSKIYVFSSRRFIVRINPDQKPALYTLTQHALDFAQDKAVDSLPSHKQRKEPKKVHEKAVPLLSGVAKIKELESRFQAVKVELTQAEQKVVDLKELDLNAEERDLDGQIRNYEERLLVVRNRKKEIEGIRAKISQAKDEVFTIKRKLEAKELAQGHEEFENLKKLFLS